MKTWQDIKDHTHFFTTNDDVKLAYATFGPENGKPLIFVGGYFSTMATWVAQIDVFEAAGYRVILFDRRNHGQSQVVDYGMTIYRHAEDLRELITVLGYDKVTLVGHSQGAASINAYLTLYGDEQLHGIVLIDQTLKAINDETWSYGIFNLTWASLIPVSEAIQTTKMTVKKISDEIKSVLRPSYEQDFDFEGTRQLLLDTIIQDYRKPIERLTVPALLLGAGKSPLFPNDHVLQVQKLNPQHVEAHIIPDVGHVIQIEAPNQLNERILLFLNHLFA